MKEILKLENNKAKSLSDIRLSVLFISTISLPYSKETLAKENVPKEKKRASFLLLWNPPLHACVAQQRSGKQWQVYTVKNPLRHYERILNMGAM